MIMELVNDLYQEQSVTKTYLDSFQDILDQINKGFSSYQEFLFNIQLNFLSYNDEDEQKYFALTQFIISESIIEINEEFEQATKNLISLQAIMKNVLKDIQRIENPNQNNSNNKSNLWADPTQLNSASPRVIAHYVIQTLGSLISNDIGFVQSLFMTY